MDEPDRSTVSDNVPQEPRPQRFKTVAEMWLSDDPPWDREVLENIDELSGHLEELRAWGDRGGVRAWCDLR